MVTRLAVGGWGSRWQVAEARQVMVVGCRVQVGWKGIGYWLLGYDYYWGGTGGCGGVGELASMLLGSYEGGRSELTSPCYRSLIE